MLHPQSKVFPAPHPSHVLPDGIQDEDNEYKEEKSHLRSMTDQCTSKPAAKPKVSPTTRVSKKAAPAEEGTLSKQGGEAGLNGEPYEHSACYDGNATGVCRKVYVHRSPVDLEARDGEKRTVRGSKFSDFVQDQQ